MNSHYYHTAMGGMPRGKHYSQDQSSYSQGQLPYSPGLYSPEQFPTDYLPLTQPQPQTSFEIPLHYDRRNPETQPLKVAPGSFNHSPQEQVLSSFYSPRPDMEVYKSMARGDSPYAMSPPPSESEFISQHPFQAVNEPSFMQHSHVNMAEVNSSPEHFFTVDSSTFNLVSLDDQDISGGFNSASNQYPVSPDDTGVRYGDCITAATSSYPSYDGDYFFDEEDTILSSTRGAGKINTSKNRKRGPEPKTPKANPAPKKLRATPSPISARPPVSVPAPTPAPTLIPAPTPVLMTPRSCVACAETFPDIDAFREHSHSAHGRALVCIFGYAGCDNTFGSKNEWKRHVTSQHIVLRYWRCREPECIKASTDGRGTIFNRKDLYTQHVRRMHVPAKYKEAVDNKTPCTEWDVKLKAMQKDAEMTRCELPVYMRCPAEAAGCEIEFKGATAWDDRMEHVALHLSRAGDPEEPRVCFGGDGDPTLTAWAAGPAVGIVRRVGAGNRWVLAEPVKTTAKELVTARKAGKARAHDSEDDAEGEPDAE